LIFSSLIILSTPKPSA